MRYSVTLSLMLAAAAPALVDAQTYPAKPIRIIVSYPAGGANDIVARTVGQKLNEMLGANIVVDNRSGAGGTIGADIAAKAPPDGYTLLMAAGAHTLAPSCTPNCHTTSCGTLRRSAFRRKAPICS